MVKQVESKTFLSHDGRLFFLVWDDSGTLDYACSQCALKDVICKGTPDDSLVHLCATIQQEECTFFIEINS